MGLTEHLSELQQRLGIADDELVSARQQRAEGEEFVAHRKFEEGRYQEPTECEGMLRFEDQTGVLWLAACDQCGFEVGVRVDELDPQRLTDHRLAAANLPPQFAGKQFEASDAQDAALRVVRTWIRSFKPRKLSDSLPGLALWGQAGRGKSHLLSMVVETLIRNTGVDATYRSALELFDELQAGMDSPVYEARWQRVLTVPVLALDDIGAGRMTDWRQDRLMALVDHRTQRELPLLIATNVPPAGWEGAFGPRTASRLRGLCLPVRLEGPDRREQEAQQLFSEHAETVTL